MSFSNTLQRLLNCDMEKLQLSHSGSRQVQYLLFFFFFKLEALSQPQHFKEFMTAVLYAELRAVAVIYP